MKFGSSSSSGQALEKAWLDGSSSSFSSSNKNPNLLGLLSEWDMPWITCLLSQPHSIDLKGEKYLMLNVSKIARNYCNPIMVIFYYINLINKKLELDFKLLFDQAQAQAFRKAWLVKSSFWKAWAWAWAWSIKSLKSSSSFLSFK